MKRDIQSLANGLDIIDLLVEADRPLGVTELATKMNLDKSTVYRLLSTLVNRSYVYQEAETRRYLPSLKIITHARKIINDIQLRSVARPYLKRLTLATGESSDLAILAGLRVVYIDHEDTVSSLNVQAEIGQIAPPYCTALGKALTVQYSAEEIQNLYKDYVFRRFTSKTITDINELIAHLKVVKERGYAMDEEEYNFGVSQIAAPIFDYSNKVVAALGISGPSIRITSERIEELTRYVVDAAHEISVKIGQRA
jgi:DNA-binding IclR family transcriptional regulator